jgi:hypothetical protein
MASNVVTCRICLDAEEKINMIVPCNCIGSIKYVHRECLDSWRSSGINPKNLTHCPVCHAVYETEYRGIGRYSSMSVAVAWVVWDLLWKMLLATFVGGYVYKLIMCYIAKYETMCFAHYYWPESDHEFTWIGDHMAHGLIVFLAVAGLYAIGRGIYLWWTGNDQRRRGRRLGNDGQPLDPQNNNDIGPHDNDDFEHGGGHRPLNHNPYRRSFFYWNDPFLWLPFPRNRGSGGGGGGGGSSSSSRSDSDCKKDCGKFLLVVVVVVGIAFITYFIAKCIYKTIKEENEKMRKTLAKQYYVVDKRSKPEYRAQREAKKRRAQEAQQTHISVS